MTFTFKAKLIATKLTTSQLKTLINSLFLMKLKPLRVTFQGFFFFFLMTLLTACDSPLTFAQSNDQQSNHSYPYTILPQGEDSEISNEFMNIKLKGTIALRKKVLNGVPLSELSGIAWDEDEQLLYAVSDEGLLYHFNLMFSKEANGQKLISMQAIFATSLKNSSGYALNGKYSDSEGLAIINGNNGKKGDTQLVVSFENKPRIVIHSPTGRFIRQVDLRKKLNKKKTYRSKNKALESVTYHPKYGILTAAEYPIKKNNMKQQTLYAASKDRKKKLWHFNAANATNSAITGLETLADGSVLILERAYQNPITPIIINLRRLRLDQCDASQKCQTETIATFNGADGWLLDNFEGLAHIRDNEYLMVSDNNQNPLQKTILVHFEIITK